MFDFQGLVVYKKAKEFNYNIYRLRKKVKLGRNIDDQLSRAAWSIPLNIAEGSGRFSKADRRNFFTISRSSVFECVSILDNLHDMQILQEEDYNCQLHLAEELSKILYTMIRNLEKT